MNTQVLVVIGVGGMGLAIARRLGSGKSLLLSDFSETTLQTAADSLRGDGHDVATHRVDVSSHAAVTELAQRAAEMGSVSQVAHTAGLSPNQATSAAILAVDLAGVGFVLEEFGRVIAGGGAGVVIASMAGHLAPPLTAEQEAAVISTPADQLLNLPFVNPDELAPGVAYGIAKRANHLQVRAASGTWGDRGARINAISPGVISTPMGQKELASEHGHFMRAMIDASGSRRAGSPDDIASAAAFLLGPDSTFITGNDLLVDGGAVAALRAGRVKLPV